MIAQQKGIDVESVGGGSFQNVAPGSSLVNKDVRSHDLLAKGKGHESAPQVADIIKVQKAASLI